MPADPSIYNAIRPTEQPGPLDQYAKMLSVKSMMDSGELSALQRQQLSTELTESQAFKDAIRDGQGLTPAELLRRATVASPTRGFQLQKQMTDQQLAEQNLAKAKLENHAKASMNLRDAAAAATDQAGWDRYRQEAVQLVCMEKAQTIPAQFTPEVRQSALLNADKALEQLKEHYTWEDVGGKKVLTQNNPRSTGGAGPVPSVAPLQKGFAPHELLNARLKASEQDPYGMTGARELVERAARGGAPAAGGDAPAAASPAGAAALSAGKTGDEFLASLPKPVADQVKALADGRMAFPTGFALKSPHWQNMITMVAQYDPNFDAVNYGARNATRKAFTSGSESKSLNALNTVMGHLDELDKNAEGLNNTGFTLWNQAVNAVKGSVDPDLKARLNSFNITKQAVVDEMERAYRGAGGSQSGIDAWKKTLSDADSYTALRASIQQGVKLLNSKIESLGDQYDKGMGTSGGGLKLLAPHAQDTFNRLIKDRGDERTANGKVKAGNGIKFLGFD